MTLCIAVHAFKANAIVTISDMMLSDDVSSADIATMKSAPLGKSNRWWAMYAGIPSEFEELRTAIIAKLGADPKPEQQTVIAAVEGAYAAAITRRIERDVLGNLGMSRADFLASGLERLGQDYFHQLGEECRAVALETELLILGFGTIRPHILHARKGNGSCISYDQLGFHAIGTGAWAALGSLFAHPLFRTKPLNEVVYRLCEAKFIGETARSVGGMAVVQILQADGQGPSFPVGGDDDVIKGAWTQQKDVALPVTAIREINAMITPQIEKRFDPKRTIDPSSKTDAQ